MSRNRIRRPRARLDRLSGAAGSSLVVGRVDEASRQACSAPALKVARGLIHDSQRARSAAWTPAGSGTQIGLKRSPPCPYDRRAHT